MLRDQTKGWFSYLNKCCTRLCLKGQLFFTSGSRQQNAHTLSAQKDGYEVIYAPKCRQALEQIKCISSVYSSKKEENRRDGDLKQLDLINGLHGITRVFRQKDSSFKITQGQVQVSDSQLDKANSLTKQEHAIRANKQHSQTDIQACT